MLHAFNSVGKTDGFILDKIGEGTEAVRCLECVFRNTASFKKVLAQGMNDLAIFDERNNCLVRKAELLEEAERITEGIDLVVV